MIISKFFQKISSIFLLSLHTIPAHCSHPAHDSSNCDDSKEQKKRARQNRFHSVFFLLSYSVYFSSVLCLLPLCVWCFRHDSLIESSRVCFTFAGSAHFTASSSSSLTFPPFACSRLCALVFVSDFTINTIFLKWMNCDVGDMIMMQWFFRIIF